MFIELRNAPNIRFHGSHINYSSVIMMTIYEAPSILNWSSISIIQPRHLLIYFLHEKDGVVLKENLVISYPLQTLEINNCRVNADSLDNVLHVRHLIYDTIYNGIIPIHSTVETLRLLNCSTIIFTKAMLLFS